MTYLEMWYIELFLTLLYLFSNVSYFSVNQTKATEIRLILR